jgi:hypothetical protein
MISTASLVIAGIIYFSSSGRVKKFADELEKDILKAGDKLNIKSLEWVDDNCSCPDGITPNTMSDKALLAQKNVKYPEDNVYYSDGTKKWQIQDFQDTKKPQYDKEIAEYDRIIEDSKKKFNNIIDNLPK